MANARLIKKRIKSISSTRKITRTMELVSTAKAKRASDRIRAAKPYAAALQDLICSAIGSSQGELTHPLCETRPVKNVVLITITANRGLCGGYNGNVFRLGLETRQKLRTGGVEVQMVMIGKKGIGYSDYQKIPLAARIADIDDKPRYEQAARILSPWIGAFTAGGTDQVLTCSMHYESASRQAPRVEQILPVRFSTGENAQVRDYLWDPPPAELLDPLVSQAVPTQFLRVLMEAAACEQIARRIAMKNATENAKDLIKTLTGTYNRARQTQITQQIAEIVGGAEAIK